jgi:hypothetical protein
MEQRQFSLQNSYTGHLECSLMTSLSKSSCDKTTRCSLRRTVFRLLYEVLDTSKLCAATIADESRKICAGALQKVLVKVAFRNPGLNLTNVLRSLPPDADLEALKALVAAIVDKVSGIKRVEGDRVD